MMGNIPENACPFCGKKLNTPEGVTIHATKIHGKKRELLWEMSFTGYKDFPIPVKFWEAVRNMAIKAIELEGKIFKGVKYIEDKSL